MSDNGKFDPSNFNYHYKRDEFEASRHTSHQVFRDGPFKRNRTLLITLLDIAVIVIIITVVIPLIRKPGVVPNFEGYRLELSSYRTDDRIFLNLMITNRQKTSSDGAELADLEFSMAGSDQNAGQSDLLPLPGESLTYRAVFRDDGSEEGTVRIAIGDDSTVLRIRLPEK